MTAIHPALPILEDLIRLQSVNPAYGDGAAGESAVAGYVAERCRRAGLRVARQQVFPGRENVIVELRTGRPDRTLLFESHMDTASLGSMQSPLEPLYRGERLYGRGACDTKATLAGMIYALEEAARAPGSVQCDLVLCAAVDEEHAYRGVLRFLDLKMEVAGAVVGEPTEMSIVIAHKGCARFAVQTHGLAAHSSVPHEGDSAIYQMARVLRFVEEEIEQELAAVHHPLVGSPTIVVGRIKGGLQVNIVPERCAIEIDRRVNPGEDPEQVVAEFEERLRRRFAGSRVRASVEPLLLDWPLNTLPQSAVVQAATESARALGLNPELRGVPYGSDASKLQGLGGIPAIVFGPGSIAQAHSASEWVPVAAVTAAAEFYKALTQRFR